jgi:peptidyl-tRNA hydrolase, PTH2 family
MTTPDDPDWCEACFDVDVGLCEHHTKMKAEAELPKQVLVIRRDLKMRRGKEVSQGAHASGKVFFDTIDREVLERGWPDGFSRIKLTIEVDKSMFLWLAGIFKKVCCQVRSEEGLLEIYERAKGAGLPCCLITDQGRTEFHGVPTHTAVCIGPALPEEIDPITGDLKLL